MSLESVAEDIRDQARAEADELLEDAENQAEKIISDAEARAEEIIEQRKQELERQVKQERERGRSSANLEAKQRRLETRRDILERVRSAVEEHVDDIEGDTRRELTDDLLTAGVAKFDDSEELVVRCSDRDTDLVEELIADDERLELGDPIDALGGVIVEGTTTKMRVNNSFDTVLDDVWDEELRTFSQQLFDE